MERRIEEDVDGWPTRPIDGGYDGLRQLAAADFSGAVRANGATLFMLNGRIVGIFDGSIDAFDGASGTAHKAPHPALPLLYAMQERGGEVRAKYYTNDTPISEVDQTLSEGGFTGFVELSENVLSGDYYLVYHAGNAMSVAFIGNSGKLVTGEDAFERADDEVGIYEVNDVDVDVRDVPGLGDESDGDAEDQTADASGERDDGDDVETDDSDGPETDDAGGPNVEDTDRPGTNAGAAATETGAGTPDTDERRRDDGDTGATSPTAGVEPTGSPDEPESVHADGAAADSDAGGDSTASDDGVEPPPASGRQAGQRAGGSVGVADEVVREGADEDGDQRPNDHGGRRPDDRNERANDDRDAVDAPDLTVEPDDESVGERDEEDADATEGRGTSTEKRSTSTETRATSTDAAGDVTERPTAPTGTDAASTGGATRDRADTTTDSDAPRSAAGRGTDRRTDATEAEADAASTSRGGGTRAASSSAGEATTIPSLDPDRSEAVEPSVEAGDRSVRSEPTSDASTASRQPTEAATDAVDDTFEEEVLEREDRIDRLQQRASNLEAERDEIAAERDRLAERVETLEDENESLQAELRQLKRDVEDLEAGATTAGAAGTEQSGPQQLQPRAALEGTDLFVRYDSKGAATLEDAHDGTATAEEVNQNLRLDLHTRFDAAEATVGDEPFEQFLEDTMAYRFVDWLVRKLPYEVRGTGQEAAMRDLYDALPEVDRVEFHGVVELTYEENGETVQAEEPFDVVVRDRMGEALFVADLNDSRDPADDDMLVDLQSGATRVKETTGALAGAFAVTRSFFDPDALETAAEATSGSLLSRDSRKSYVKVSRKRGYHLCLVEARGEDLHLNVPEL